MGDPVGDIESVKIRSYPKAVFLYPTFIAAVVSAVLCLILRTPQNHWAPKLPGDIFFTVFAINILITAWDFSRTGFITVVLLGAVGILLAVVVEMKVDFLGPLHHFLSNLQLGCPLHVYLALAALFGFLLALSVISSRLDYWEVHGSEILHVTGVVGNVERFPAPNLRFRKELPDVFEYALLRSGTLVLEPVSGEKHRLTHVLLINGVERKVEALLSTIDVTLEKPTARPDAPAN